MKKKFAALLLQWNENENRRSMPWKGEGNPYYIWLSEIILQQTRVEQGLPYFNRFKTNYPTIKHLALASEDEVLLLWQGLGYYSRARNLLETARNIHYNFGGKFPNTFDALKNLKGVGDYTAAAIASFAFGEQKAVVDGNVIRVLSRIFGIATPFDTTTGKKEFAALAQSLVTPKNPGAYNQAIMDFGSTICKPKNPLCKICPFNKQCMACLNGKVDEYPVRLRRNRIKNRYLTCLLIEKNNKIFIQKRTGNDIWKGLYQLPNFETKKPVRENFGVPVSKYLSTANFEITGVSKQITQMLSHQKIHFRFIHIKPGNLKSLAHLNAAHVPVKSLSKYAMPKSMHLYLFKNSLF